MKTYQLNTRIDEKAYGVLERMSKRLHTTKAHLTEKAIYLLKEKFDNLEASAGPEEAEDLFLSLLAKSTTQYDDLYRKLAK